MSITVDLSFVKQFEREVHQAYQRQGAKLRGLVRTVTGVKGTSTTFQKVGTAAAGTKPRHGLVPVMNVDHSTVECYLADYYAGEWSDKLDELKQNIDERQVLASAGAFALGRKTDDLIITALGTATTSAGSGADGLTKAKVLKAFETLGTKDVPDDGQRVAVVGWQQWTNLLGIAEFASSDYVAEDMLPWKGCQAKMWLGTMWLPHSGLSIASSIRTCFWFHKTAVGHAIGADVTTDITWHGDRAAHFVSNSISQGAVLIDDNGVVKMPCLES